MMKISDWIPLIVIWVITIYIAEQIGTFPKDNLAEACGHTITQEQHKVCSNYFELLANKDKKETK